MVTTRTRTIIRTNKIVENRRLHRDDLRILCIEKQWYTRGDCKAYERLLDMCDEDCYLDTVGLCAMAKDIISHSDMKNGETLTSVMFELARKCVVTFDEIES